MKLILASEFSVSAKKSIRLLEACDLRSKKGLFITTAAIGEGFVPDRHENVEPLEALGLDVEEYDLCQKSEQDVREKLSDVAVVSVCGGNTFFLLQHMKSCNFVRVIKELFPKGLVYVGSSAGAIVCSPDISFVDGMDDPARAELLDTHGLGLIDFAFLPHLDHPFMGSKAQQRRMKYRGEAPMLALHDDQLLFVQDRVVTLY